MTAPAGATGLAGAGSAEILDRVFDPAHLIPDRPATEDPTRRLDYPSLRTEVGEVAAGLAAAGVAPGDRVGIHLPNSVDFVVAALAALWVGAVFVPLAVSDPEARLAVITEDCDPVVIVTGGPDAEVAPLADRRARTLEELRIVGGTPPPAVRDPDRATYAIYTSGTTGTPKGVLIGQRAFLAAVDCTVAALDLNGSTRTLCVSAFHFDGSFATLFPTLVVGGCAVIPRRDSLLFARTFFHGVADHAITYTGFSPSYLRLLLSNPRVTDLAATPLRVIALGGEAASRADVEAFRAAVPQVRIFNRYGPTETTIAVTHYEVPPVPAGDTSPVPIGRPHPGSVFVLVDEGGAVIDGAGPVGELYVGGPQVMLGYWGAPELSASVLRSDIVAGTTLYRTGDLVARDRSGDYLYVDRANRVVKRNGIRISLVELTEVLRRVPGVSAAATSLYAASGHLGIAAFVVAAPGQSADQVQRAAHHHLPATMLPDVIVIVDALPVTPAGKVDERRLLSGAGLASTADAAAARSGAG